MTPRNDAPRSIFEFAPKLEAALPWVRLADLPTPVRHLAKLEHALGAGGELFQKCDDVTSPVYGGNKVRTLEVLLGDAVRRGSTHVFSTGAYGSNHAAATILHAPRVGLTAGALLYPQPESRSSYANLRLVLDRASAEVHGLAHWSALPFGMWAHARAARRSGKRATLMMPGGSTPLGAIGYVSAALELATQVHAGELPLPSAIVVAAGSNCTTAGLLVGIALAVRRGLGFTQNGVAKPPRLVAVRVTPWPVTSRFRVLGLAQATSELLATLAGDAKLACRKSELAALLELDGSELGSGYGIGTEAGREAARLWHDYTHAPLELTYSGKSAAAALARLRAKLPGPLVYWATKSSAPLPAVSEHLPEDVPERMRRWLARAEKSEAGS